MTLSLKIQVDIQGRYQMKRLEYLFFSQSLSLCLWNTQVPLYHGEVKRSLH